MLLCHALILCLIAAPAGLSAAEDTQTLKQDHSIYASGGRVLFDAASEARNLFTVPINLEEVPLQAAKDLIIPTNDKLQWISGRKGTIQTECLAGDDARVCMERVLAEYYNAGLPGTYSVSEVNGEVYITPVMASGADGRDMKISPIMSTRVSFPEIERPTYKVIELLAEKAGSINHTKVVIGMIPYGDNDVVTIGANGESLSEILAKIDAWSGQQSYSLLYEPQHQTYYLNLSSPVGGPSDLRRQARSRSGTTSRSESQKASPFLQKRSS